VFFTDFRAWGGVQGFVQIELRVICMFFLFFFFFFPFLLRGESIRGAPNSDLAQSYSLQDPRWGFIASVRERLGLRQPHAF